MTTVLLDTNVVIDLLQKRIPDYDDARAIFDNIAKGKYVGCISAKQVADVYYLMHHYLHDDKLTRKNLVQLTDLLRIIDVNQLDCRAAIDSKVGDFEDAMLVESAKRNNIECIVSRNAKDFVNSGITVYSPREFLDLPEIIDFTAA